MSDKLITLDNLKEFKAKCDTTYALKGETGGGTSIEAFTIVDIEEPPFQVTNGNFYKSIAKVVDFEGGILPKPLLLRGAGGAYCWIIKQEDFAIGVDSFFMRFLDPMFGGKQIVKYTKTAPFMVSFFSGLGNRTAITNWFNEKIDLGTTKTQVLTLKQGIDESDIEIIVELLNWVTFIEIEDAGVIRRLPLMQKGILGIIFALSIINTSQKTIQMTAVVFGKDGITLENSVSTIQ